MTELRWADAETGSSTTRRSRRLGDARRNDCQGCERIGGPRYGRFVSLAREIGLEPTKGVV